MNLHSQIFVVFLFFFFLPNAFACLLFSHVSLFEFENKPHSSIFHRHNGMPFAHALDTLKGYLQCSNGIKENKNAKKEKNNGFVKEWRNKAGMFKQCQTKDEHVKLKTMVEIKAENERMFSPKQTQVLASYIKAHWYGFTYTVVFLDIFSHLRYSLSFFFFCFAFPRFHTIILSSFANNFYCFLSPTIAYSDSFFSFYKNIFVFLKHLLIRYILKYLLSLYFSSIFLS